MTQLPTNPQSFKPLRGIAAIVREVARRHGISPEDIINPIRNGRLAVIRHKAMYLVLLETRAPITVIAQAFNRDRTTVMYGIAAHCRRNNLPLPHDVQWAVLERPPSPRDRKKNHAPVDGPVTWASQLAKEVRQSFR